MMGSDTKHFFVTILLVTVPTGLFIWETVWRSAEYPAPFGEHRWFVGGTAATIYIIAMAHLIIAAVLDPGWLTHCKCLHLSDGPFCS
jgi:hypothetical protein